MEEKIKSVTVISLMAKNITTEVGCLTSKDFIKSKTGLKWSQKRPKNVFLLFQCGTSVVDHSCFCVLCFSPFCVCSLLPCGHLLGKG